MYEQIIRDNPLLTLKNYQGFYQCPKDTQGNFSGYLVGYAGTYTDNHGNQKNFVGDTYYNIAMVETFLETRQYFSGLMIRDCNRQKIAFPDKVIGMPMGGIKFSQTFGDLLGIPSIFAEKNVLSTANPEKGLKEISDIVIARHEIVSGENVFIIEDLCNNFSTTQKVIEIIQSLGATVTGIACVVNRSDLTRFDGIPVISAIFNPSAQYKQEDKEVEAAIRAKKVIWKPKHFWHLLE